MRFLALVLALLLSLGLQAETARRAATAAELALFKEALQKSAQDTDHWAYTETRSAKGSKGVEQGVTVMRFDPSKPYDEQYTLLSSKGQPPTEKELKKYREMGEKRGKRILAAAEKGANPAKPREVTLGLGGQKMPIDIEHPLVAGETADEMTFELPLKDTVKEVPRDKIEILVHVNKGSRLITTVWFRVKESFRMKLVAKIKAGSVKIDFAVVNPEFRPVITSISGDFSASVIFIPVNGVFTQTRSDWQRVKPYHERFQVKMAPLEFLDF